MSHVHSTLFSYKCPSAMNRVTAS